MSYHHWLGKPLTHVPGRRDMRAGRRCGANAILAMTAALFVIAIAIQILQG